MSLVSLLLVLVLVGVILWAINSFIPMDAKVKQLINIVVIVFLVLWLLRAFGVLGHLSQVRV